MINTHLGWCSLIHLYSGKRIHNKKPGMGYILHHSPTRYVVIFLVAATGSLYMVQSPQKSLCRGDDPPIRNTEICIRAIQVETRNRRYQSSAQRMVGAPWSIDAKGAGNARCFGGNANSWFSFPMFQLKTKTNPSPLGRLEKTLNKLWKLPW